VRRCNGYDESAVDWTELSKLYKIAPFQTGSEQLVGKRTGLGRGLTAAHQVLSNCKKTKLSVAESCSSSTPVGR